MKDMPGGVWITMAGECKRTGVELFCLGYKYNKKKCPVFMCTKGVASTQKGVPYQAKFNDSFGNVHHRDVPRPQVLNLHFHNCNKVDVHNQARQHELALEENWVTHDGYFRQWTTFLGICITDLWLLKEQRHHTRVGSEPESRNLLKFADELAYSLLEKAENSEHRPGVILCPLSTTTDNSGSKSPSQSTLTPDDFCATPTSNGPHSKHTPKYYIRKKGTRTRSETSSGGKQARCVWCSRVEGKKNVKTQLTCEECGTGFCNPKSGRDCWNKHVAHGGPLIRPPRKRTKC